VPRFGGAYLGSFVFEGASKNGPPDRIGRKCKLDLTGQAWAQRFLAKPIRQARPAVPAAPPAPPMAPPEQLTESVLAKVEAEFEALRKRNAEKRAAKRDKPYSDPQADGISLISLRCRDRRRVRCGRLRATLARVLVPN
jgi:hypothetical protein